MAKFRTNELLHFQSDGVFGAEKRKDHSAVDGPSRGARHDGD